jgi:glycosyltransferase involved in cell wall biosynthesis
MLSQTRVADPEATTLVGQAMSGGRRILIDAVAATSGGGAIRLLELARTLPRYRPDDALLFVAQGAQREALQESGSALRVVSPPRPFSKIPGRLAWEHFALPIAARRRFDPDVVLAPFNIAPLCWADPAPSIVAIVSNLAPYSPEVCSLYRGRELLRLRALRALTDRTLARAQRIFLLSQQAFDLIDHELLRGKAELLPMAPPLVPALGAMAAKPPVERYLLVAGDLLRYKGIETLIRALRLLAQESRPHVLIAGRPLDRPYVRDLQRLAGENAVAEHVVFLGSVSHSSLLGLMRQSIACIATSRFENPSRVPVEAMAVGAPVIASDIPEFRSSCGDAALFFTLDRPEQLARCISRLVLEPRLAQELRARGRAQLATLHAGSAAQRIAEAIATIADRPVGAKA